MILGAEPITRLRYEMSVGQDRRGVRTLVESKTIRASVQPLTDRQREALPELIRQSVEKRIYTKSEVRADDQTTGLLGDRLKIDGELYEVLAVKHWRKLLAHYEVDIRRLKEPDDPRWRP